MKKLMNQAENLVMEMCNGLVLAHPELQLNEKYKVIFRRQLKKSKVSLISGGGSGHEPAHAGFVGAGMLDAAVFGDVFASPSQIQVYQAIKQVATEQGVLMIIKNYSGDIMNFKNGAALAAEDGIVVDYVKVDDDIAVEDSLYTVGRRGVAGTVFVHKIAGAAAELGFDLATVKKIAEKAAGHVRSIGFAYTSCTVPTKGTPMFSLGEDEMEYGVGIHGEPGIRREKMMDANALAERMVKDLLNDLGNVSEVAVLINGFGATPLQELYVFNNSVIRTLTKQGVNVHRTFVGNFMTSIDMAGASLSILKLDDELKQYFNAPASTPAFKVDGEVEPIQMLEPIQQANNIAEPSFKVETNKQFAKIINEQFSLGNMHYYIDKMSEVIIENEVPFCELDSYAGDGDFGMSVAKGFKQLKREWTELTSEPSMNAFLYHCSMIIMEHCGGASGPIWGSAFRAAGKAVEGKEFLAVSDFAAMLQAAVKGIQTTGERSFGRGAVVGDKTLIDAFVPCANVWSEAANETTFADIFKRGALAAVEGAEATKHIVARMGRAGTVGDRSLGYPDAGAYGLGVIFTALAEDVQ
ncbi:dihydroxyacetone kinase subunit DhaK [Solibacillus sp. FSL R7-0682]|uniref:dihydroxyacetone kinase subunit DhaK n=1 Tax=Solibacillus sp. FSL R7-0682 TaxID=2921690 RepID=UPI0030F64F92